MSLTIPIPQYLNKVAFAEAQKGKLLYMKIKCPCGCEKFEVYKGSAETNSAEVKAWYKKREQYFNSFKEKIYGYSFRNDENGFYETGLALVDNGKRQIYVGRFYYKDKPDSIVNNVLKIKCTECGEEYILFDNSRYGYDGRICRSEKKNDYGAMKFKQIKRKISHDFTYEVKVRVENDLTFEDFKKASGSNCTAEEYSDGFSWISIFISANDSTIKIYDEETA